MKKNANRSKKVLINVFTFVFFFCTSDAFAGEPHSYIPPQGIVPTKETAVAIALAVALPIYGDERLQREQPSTATLVDDKWIVEGQFNESIGAKGGVLVVEISKVDGKILRISHGK